MGTPSAMRWLLVANVLGLIAAGVYGGAVASAARVPWWALAAGAVFLVAVATPLIAEYRSIGHGFGEIEQSFLARTRKPYFPNAEPEVFAPNGAGGTAWKGRRPPLRSVLALTIIAMALFAADVASYVRALPPPSASSGKISNY